MNELNGKVCVHLLCAIMGLLLVCSAWAQTSGEEAGDAPAENDRLARAPDEIDIDALEPAVDVSRLPPTTGTVPRQAEGSPRQSAASPPAEQIRPSETLDLGTTSITGNQELPKVLYIVPWKRSDLGDLVGRPVNSLLEEALAPVDPQVFERRLSYYESLYGEGQQE